MGNRFHQEILVFERRFISQMTQYSKIHMLGEYCWFICRDEEPDEEGRELQRKSKKRFFILKQNKE